MRKKRVWRYYCDHCKKAGCSGGHMARHESSCCGNPDRVCRMCVLGKQEQKPTSELLAVYEKDGVKGVRALANGCPACILAAIIIWRKQNDPDPYQPEYWEGGFDFKKERDSWFAEKNYGEDQY